MIVAGPEGFRKNQYRKFNIRSADLAPGDDFGMMREVLEPPLQAADQRVAQNCHRSACNRRVCNRGIGIERDICGPGAPARRGADRHRRHGRRRGGRITLARSRADRRRPRPAHRRARDAHRARHHRRAARRHRQGARSRRRRGDVLHARARAVQAPAARPAALFRAAAARRGASVRGRLAPRAAQGAISARPACRRSPASARPASARCCAISGRSRRSSAPLSPISPKFPASAPKPPARSTISSTSGRDNVACVPRMRGTLWLCREPTVVTCAYAVGRRW